MTHCEHCGGSGVLNVEASYDLKFWWSEASACHACDVGLMWTGLGL